MGNNGDAADPTAGSGAPGKPLTAQDRRELAEAEIRRTADNASATEAERYRASQPDEGAGIGASASGTMYGQIGTGSGYRIDPDALAAKIPRWEGLLHRLEMVKGKYQAAKEEVYSPVEFPPSDRQAEATRVCAERGATHAQAVHDYIAGFIESAKNTHGGYTAKEEETEQAMGKSTPEDSGDHGAGSLYEKGGK